jgi:hypothetical protein
MTDIKENNSPKQRLGRLSLILSLLLGLVCLVALIMVQWNDLHQNNRILDASLLAVSTSDYSGSRPTGQMQVIGLAIVGDQMRDAGLQPGDLSTRLASVTAVLLSPVPTATLMHSFNITPTPTQTRSAASYTPDASPTPPPLTATAPAVTDTANPVSYPTETKPPASLPTPLPIATHTLVPTHIPTVTPTHVPTRTPAPTSTRPPRPSMTPTPRSGCRPPGHSHGSLPDGFIQRVDPADGSRGVPVSRHSITVFFTQAMKDVNRQNLYEIRNEHSGRRLTILAVTYNPANFSATITFDTHRDWDWNTDYRVTFDRSIENACGMRQDHDVTTTFRTGSH